MSLSSAFPLRTLHPSRRPELDAIEVVFVFCSPESGSIRSVERGYFCFAHISLPPSARFEFVGTECLSRSRKL